jgi:type 1 glutamine amidotransferase
LIEGDRFMTLNRREMLRSAGAGLLAPAVLARAAFAARKTPRVLFFTKSAGFEHSVIARKDGQLGHAEKILAEIGKANGYEVVCSKDGGLFEPGKIGDFDAFAFYTTGVLTEPGNDKQPPMSKAGKQALLDAIAAGKGFIGFHSATDSFHSPANGPVDPYIRMIGGEFIVHGAQQVAKIRVTDPKFPSADAFGGDFELMDEWYTQKNIAEDLRVIFAHDTEGMKGPMYQRPSFPMTWARMHDRGRVFYTSMGHREDVWANPKFQAVALGGLAWITGKADADVTPNLSQVTPEANKLAR